MLYKQRGAQAAAAQGTNTNTNHNNNRPYINSGNRNL